MVTRAQATVLGTAEGLPDEEDYLDPYDILDDLDDECNSEIAETPVPISIRDVLDAQQTDRFC